MQQGSLALVGGLEVAVILGLGLEVGVDIREPTLVGEVWCEWVGWVVWALLSGKAHFLVVGTGMVDMVVEDRVVLGLNGVGRE